MRRVERYAGASRTTRRPEPLPWAEFHIERGRALAAFGQGSCGTALLAELRRIRDEGSRLGIRHPLARIEAAAAGA